jgi:threonine aldolase
MGAEAVIFFDPKRGANMPDRRKRGGATASKHRFIAAQMEAYLADDLWLRLARHANDMADALGAGLTAAGAEPAWPVEANEVFAPLSAAADQRLKAAGAAYYPWSSGSLPKGYAPRDGETLVRLVTSFQTTKDDVEKFLATMRA